MICLFVIPVPLDIKKTGGNRHAGVLPEKLLEKIACKNSGALTEHGSFSPALSGQAVGAPRNSVKCP